jgi:hypothetical protein
MSQRFIVTDAAGWLNVKLEPYGQIQALPQFLKVEFTVRRDNRDFFRILEGAHRNKQASVAARGPAQSWLGTTLPAYKGPAVLTFNKSTGRMTTPIAALNAITDPSNPVPNGRHAIQLPDFPHDLGSGYVNQGAKKAKTWFHLGEGVAVPGNEGRDRYLHPGRVSAGCITVKDLANWDRLYDLLIVSRAGNGKDVGHVTVSG